MEDIIENIKDGLNEANKLVNSNIYVPQGQDDVSYGGWADDDCPECFAIPMWQIANAICRGDMNYFDVPFELCEVNGTLDCEHFDIRFSCLNCCMCKLPFACYADEDDTIIQDGYITRMCYDTSTCWIPYVELCNPTSHRCYCGRVYTCYNYIRPGCSCPIATSVSCSDNFRERTLALIGDSGCESIKNLSCTLYQVSNSMRYYTTGVMSCLLLLNNSEGVCCVCRMASKNALLSVSASLSQCYLSSSSVYGCPACGYLYICSPYLPSGQCCVRAEFPTSASNRKGVSVTLTGILCQGYARSLGSCMFCIGYKWCSDVDLRGCLRFNYTYLC